MGKSTNRSSSKSSSKRNTPTNNSGRPRPMPFKVGVTVNIEYLIELLEKYILLCLNIKQKLLLFQFMIIMLV